MSAPSFLRSRDAHGTRGCYCTGCRCDACRRANTVAARERQQRVRDAVSDVRPSGPSLDGTIARGGREHRVRLCPGANGAVCVRVGKPSWLRLREAVCRACVDRAAVWDGLVDAAPARAHIRTLAAQGVGQNAVADACDVSGTVIVDVIAGTKTRIRASTERRILSVDAGAIADGARVDATSMNARLAALRARGFTLEHLGQLLGYNSRFALQLGSRPLACAGTVARVERLWRRVARGEVAPVRALRDAGDERQWIDALIAQGVPQKWLSTTLGFTVRAGMRGRMRPSNIEAVRKLRDTIATRLREGDGLPDDWQCPATALRSLAEGFGFEGGYLVRGGR